MKYSNFFKQKKILILSVILLILSAVFIIYASIIGRGLFLDGMFWCIQILDSLADNNYEVYILPERTRDFVNILNQFPVHLAYFFGIDKKELLIMFYSLPLFLFPFLVTLYNFILVKRTKRYDIALFSLIFYSLLVLPAIMYACVESFLAGACLILQYHYLAADINYKKRDIFIIIFLCFIAFSSTELVIFIGLMMFFASLFFIKRNKSCSSSLALSPAKAITNKIVKIFIGVSSLFAAIVVLIMNLFVLEDNIEQESIWFFSELSDRPNYFTFLQEPLLLEIITVILALFIIFSKKKKLKIKNICFSLITLIYASVLIFMLINKETYFLSFCFISYRVLIYFFLPLIFIYLCLSDYLKKYINKNTLYNLYIIVLLCAICNTFIQIYYSYRVQNIQSSEYTE